MSEDAGRDELAESIVERLARRHSTAVVLMHAAVAERLGLGPADHKCLDLLRERGMATGSELAAMTGLTTGAVTGVVARLKKAGYLRREPDPHDGRKQILRPVPERVDAIYELIAPLRYDLARMLLGRFDRDQLAAVAEFLVSSAEVMLRHAALLRAQPVSLQPPPSPQDPAHV